MNTRILLLALSVAALSSCSSAYRSGQTPDDVYYSPSRQPSVVARNNNSDDEYLDVRQPKSGTNYQSYEQYQDNYRDERFLRMSVGNPYYMDSYNSYSGFDWRYNSMYYGYNYGFNSPWNNYFAWNNFYNPYSAPYSYYGLGLGYGGYYGGGYYGTGGGYYAGGGGVKYTNFATPISRPVTFNVNSYTNNRPASRSYSPNNSYYNNGQRYNNTNSNSNSGGNRSYYNNSNSGNRNSNSYTPANNNSNNNYTPARTYTPSSGGGGGGGSTGGGGGGGSVGRPGRGN